MSEYRTLAPKPAVTNSSRARLGKAGTKSWPPPKPKSGCPACKVRRVNPDDKRPSCRRCLLAGSVCSGHNVWTGIQSALTARYPTKPQIEASYISSAVIAGLSYAERRHFEWFVCQTSGKLPGVFNSLFWENLVLQASYTEPAVAYAVLALGAASKSTITFSGVVKGEEAERQASVIQENLMLQYYNKSIFLLQTHLRTPSSDSIRVALIVCMIFVCLEFIQQHYRIGIIHFRHSLKLIKSLLKSSAARRPNDPVDDWLVDATSRLDVQAILLTNESYNGHDTSQPPPSDPQPQLFRTIRDASQCLNGLVSRAYRLQENARATEIGEDAENIFELLATQQVLRNDLSQWLRTFEEFKADTWSRLSDRERLACRLLLVYNSTAQIIAETSLHPRNEMVFDSYTNRFAWIVSSSEDILEEISPATAGGRTPELGNSLCDGTTDLDLVPVLYYTAIKCRVSSIRRRAIELFSSAPHREGIWDAALSASIAREVMSLEEGYASECLAGNTKSTPGVVATRLPGPFRVHKLWIMLPEPKGDVGLKIQMTRADGKLEALRRRFHGETGCWTSDT